MKSLIPLLLILATWCQAAIGATPVPPSQSSPFFQAGAATADITPPKLPAIIAGGFLEGTGARITDPLHARCIVLDDGRTKIAFAIVDTCMMTQSLIDEAKRLASAQCGIPADHLMVSATHTHSAPAAMGCLGTRLDKDYAAWLPGKIAEGIVAAAKKLQPARIGWAWIDDWEHTHNRRWIRKPDKMVVDPFGEGTGRANMHPGYLSAEVIGPSGPVDQGLSVLSVQTRDDLPLAVLANYSQHYFGSAPVSADYYGLFCQHVARLLGQPGEGNGPFVCAMSQGTSGDLMWMDYGSPRKTMSADEYAGAVANYAELALKQVRYHDTVPLAMVEKKLPLGFRVPDEKRLAWARPIAARIQNDLPKNKQEVYAREAIILHERQKTELKLQAIRIGELTISALPNEVYALTGLKLKAQSPFASHFNIELANGAEGYIPTPEQHVLGGYTTWPARTAGLEVQAEPKIVATLLDALEEAAGAKRRAMQDEHGPYAKSVLETKPLAYWRLNDADGKIARNAVSGGAPAQISDGAAWYLPGAGSGTGCGLHEKLTPSAFSGPNQINRALHLAGGDMQADLAGLDGHFSIALWFWLGEASGAGERSGTLIAGPGGEALGTRQSKDHSVQLEMNGAATKLKLRAEDWHFAVLVRDGNAVRVHVDGVEDAALTGTSRVPSEGGHHLRFGLNMEGKLDEVAVFNRSLTPAEIAGFWKTSGIAEQRAKETAERERLDKEIAERTQPLSFSAEYNAAIEALKPIIHAPLDVPPRGMGIEAVVQLGKETFANFNSGRIRGSLEKLGAAFSVSLWFRNEAANDAAPVTAYLFSRGPDGEKQAPGDHLGIGGTYRRDLTGRLMVFNGNASNQSVAGRTVIPPGTWNHVVFIRDGTHVRAYLNGEAKPEIDAEIEGTAPGIREIFLGARSDHFAPLHGQLAQFAMFDRALTADEARQIHTASGRPAGTAKAVALPKPKMESAPLSPEDSLKKVHVRDGYRAEFVAAEPLVLDPVAFDWDERGRLWVVEMADYPLGLDGKGKPGGRVRILEDTDGDGRYDKATLFADGLNFPTGILCWRDGCIVTAAPDILFLKDSNGSGKADSPQKLFTGFLEGNQQLRVNGLRWGFDGWVYCANGGHHVNYGKEIAITSTLTGEKIALGSRDFRFKPDTGALDPLSGPSQFGRNRDAWGHWFGVQNSYPLWHYVLEDRYLRRNPHVAPPSPKNVLTASNPAVFPASSQEKRFHSFDQAGHFTSACSAMIYLDTILFGAGSTQHSFTCEPFHNLVQHLVIEDDGITFKAHRDDSEKTDFFASEDRWCRPVMARTGPDGALWIADMYRYIIEHPQWLPQNGKDELSPFYRLGDDKGRIYRVLPSGVRPAPLKNLGATTPDELVALLESSNAWLRDKAQMLLLWRADKSVVPALEKMARDGKEAHARAYALSLLDGLGALQPGQLIAALHDPAAGVREHALRIAETHGEDAVVAEAAKLTDDTTAKVRLQLALSLGEWKQPAAGSALARLALKDADNATIRGAIISSMVPHLAALAEQTQGQRIYMDAVLSTALGEQKHDAILAVADTISTEARAADEKSLGAFRALLQALRANKTTLEQLAAQHATEPRWREVIGKKDGVIAALKSRPAGNDSAQAFAASVLLADPRETSAAVAMLGKMLGAGFHAEPFAEHVTTLAQSGDPRVPGFLMQDWEQRTPAQREPVLDAMMSREEWAMHLLGHVRESKVAASSLDAQRQARLLKHPSAKVQKLAARVFSGTVNASRVKVIEAFKPALSLRGDAARGKSVFAISCIACHQLDGVGRALGPDLRSVVQHPPEKLLNSILDPSANIEPGFIAYFCELKNGEQLYGIIAGETGGSLTLKLADGTVRNILRPDVVKLQSSKASLMPDGLEAAQTPQTVADLIAYLKTAK